MVVPSITMPRGDIRKVKFRVKSGELIRTDMTEIYISFKASTKTEEYLVQKKLSDGTIRLGEDQYYHFQINPEDTDGLRYGTYPFDFELIGPGFKQTTVGRLVLTDEVTFAVNEGTGEEDG